MVAAGGPAHALTAVSIRVFTKVFVRSFVVAVGDVEDEGLDRLIALPLPVGNIGDDVLGAMPDELCGLSVRDARAALGDRGTVFEFLGETRLVLSALIGLEESDFSTSLKRN